MSDNWQPPAGPEGTPDAPAGGSSGDDQVTPASGMPPAAGQSNAIPLPPTGGGSDWNAVGAVPSGPMPTSGDGWPTPPAGTWPLPPQGWQPGMPPPHYPGWGPSGSQPYGGQPYGGWGAPAYAPYVPPPKNARRGPAAAVATLLVVIALVAGAGLGRLIWSQPTTAASGAPGALLPGGSGSSGGSGSPFGSGASGSGSTGNSSTGAGAPSDISAIAAKVDPGLVDINTNLSYQDEQAAGTGMVLTPTGEILTNNHVIDGATSISATDVGNGKTYNAKVVGYDRTGDVAVIQLVGATGLQTVRTNSGSVAVGQAIVGVGNAGGTGGTPSTAGGSVTALDQSITASDNGGGNSENLKGLIQINAPIEPGDSGGSLVNTAGQVLGMDTAASQSSQYTVSASQAYAIPIRTALSLAGQIEAGKPSSVVHIGATGFIGVSVQDASTGSTGGGSAGGGFGFGNGSGSGGSSSGGSSSGGSGSGGSGATTGAAVAQVVSGSAAAQAGLVVGDVITAVNGAQVSSASDLSNLLEPHHPGDTVRLQWTDTSGQSQTAAVTLTNGPPA